MKVHLQAVTPPFAAAQCLSHQRVSDFPERGVDLWAGPGNFWRSPGDSQEVWETSGEPLDLKSGREKQPKHKAFGRDIPRTSGAPPIIEWQLRGDGNFTSSLKFGHPVRRAPALDKCFRPRALKGDILKGDI